MINKISSILDYSFPGLPIDIWQADGILFPYHKDLILKLISSFYESYGFKSPEQWVKDIIVVGSLTTNRYGRNSDFDCHILVDVDKFIETNSSKSSQKEAFEILDEARREWDRARILLPFGNHNLEIFFLVPEVITSNTDNCGCYSLIQDKWLKPPVYFEQDDDFEKTHKEVIEEAKKIASELDASFGEISRQIDRVDELKDVLQAWPKDKRQIYYKKIQEKLDNIEEEIEKSIQIKEDLVNKRHEQHDLLSDIELKFKYLSRFFYFSVVNELKAIMGEDEKISTEDLPLIEKVISEASLNKKSFYMQSIWLSPKGEVYTLREQEHNEWSQEQQGKQWDQMIIEGWVRINKFADIGGPTVLLQVESFNNIPSTVDEYLAKTPVNNVEIEELDNPAPALKIPYKDAIENGLQEEVNRALRMERIKTSSLKESDMKDDPGVWVDPNGKIYDAHKQGNTHGDWIRENAQLLSDNYNINIPAEFLEWSNTGKGDYDLIWNQTKDVWSEMISSGWIKIGDTGWGYGMQVLDLHRIPDYITDIIIRISSGKNWLNIEDQNEQNVRVPLPLLANIQDVVNEALRTPVMASLKQAFLKEAFEKQILAIDFDDTIAHENPDKTIGEPEAGVKEALTKLREDGYTLEIYSHRANDEKGADEIKEWLDSHEIPYDSILHLEKPAATYYIDNRGIHFTSWTDVLTQIEKSKKTASLTVISYAPEKLWIDPNGEEYQVPGSHANWILDNQDMLKKQYGWKNTKPWKFEDGGEIYDFEGLDESLVSMGWSRVGDIYGGRGWGIQVDDLFDIPKYLIDKLMGKHGTVVFESGNDHWVEVDIDEFVTKGQKAVNRAYNSKRLQPAKLHKDLNKISSLYEKYWIDPSGKEYSLGKYSHLDWIYINILHSPKGMSRGDIEFITSQEADKMLSKGWIRVTNETEGTDFAVELADLSNVSPYLDSFIASHYTGNGIELDDLQGNYVKVDDPFPYIQDAVNKSLRQPVHASKVFSKKEIVAQTKKVKQGDYSCLMALVPHDLAQEIVEFGVRTIPDGELYLDEDGKLGRELEAHVTIKYGLLTNDAKDVRRSFNDEKPFKAKLGKVKHFQPPELPFDVLTVEVISEDLEKANKKVTDSFECAKDLVSNDYHPHITIAYMKRDTAKDYIGSDVFEGKEIELDTVIFSPHKGNRTYFSISNDKESQFVLEKINKFASFSDSVWFDPKGKIYKIDSSHEDWAFDNSEFLEKTYGIEWISSYATRDLLNNGWIRIGDIGVGDSGFGIEMNDLSHVPSFVFDYIFSNLQQNALVALADEQGRFIELPVQDLVNGQKDLNRELMLNRTAAYRGNMDCWLASDGKEFSVTRSHTAWIVDEANLLKQQYGLTLPVEGSPEDDNLIAWLLSKGWVRVSGVLPVELDLLMQDINNIPPAAEQFVWKYKPEVVVVEDLNGNDTSFDREEYSKGMMKKASGNNFLPSLVQPANNEWQFQHGGPDLEIPVDPDSQSDQETLYEPCTTGKPRNPDMWRQFMSIFKSPLSKKDEMTVDSAYDPEFEEIERKELGEDETLNDYARNFYDPKKHDFPHNTTMDSLVQDMEPSKPGLAVTYSPESNDAFLDQNGPDGTPRRFMGRPKGEFSSTSGEAVETLINMLKNKEAAINSLTREITSDSHGHGYGGWISPKGEILLADDHGNAILKDPQAFGINGPLDKDHVRWQSLFENLYNEGWLRFRIWGEDLHFFGSNLESVKKAENLIFNEMNSVNEISLDLNDANYVATVEEFKKDGFDAFRRISTLDKQPVMAKQAAVDIEHTKDWLRRHKTPMDSEGRAILYHGTPKANAEAVRTNGLRQWSLLANTPEEAVHFTGRDRDLKPRNIALFEVHVPIDKLNGGVFASVAEALGPEYLKEIKISKQAGLSWNLSLFRDWINDNGDAINRIREDGRVEDYLPKYESWEQVPEKEWNTFLYNYGEDLFNEKLYTLKSLGSQFPIYRVITVKDPEAFLKALESNKFEGFSGVGIYWSYDPNAAEAHWGKFESGYRKIKLNALVNSSEIDWKSTILHNMNLDLGEEEKEITLLDGAALQVNSVDWEDKEVQVSFPVTALLKKRAGSYSSCYTDEQGEQFFNEQHHDNVDEEPYVDHSERDYDGGYWDAATNTGQNTPWAKDITPSVCLLDQLQNPADRNYPPGMPDYSITFYEAMPASDGIEATNPD